jgi:hypothetical protein
MPPQKSQAKQIEELQRRLAQQEHLLVQKDKLIGIVSLNPSPLCLRISVS